ncbi:MAG: hypothetical protein AB2A00_43675 [Myxococcota bacterium]
MRSPWALLLLLSGCAECTRPPAVADQRTVSRDEACARYEAALRRKCDNPALRFDCDAYLSRPGQDCEVAQREWDVERCEERIDRARTCDEALDTVCGTTCETEWLPPSP